MGVNNQTVSNGFFHDQSSHLATADGHLYPSTTVPSSLFPNPTNSPIMAYWPEIYNHASDHDMRARSAPIEDNHFHQSERRPDSLSPIAMYPDTWRSLPSPYRQLHSQPSVMHQAFPSMDGCVPVQSRTQSKYAVQKCHLGRFQTTLCSQTAMFYKEEVPTTYLNKGQTYMLKVVDKTPLVSGSLPVRYVTSIRISFEDDELRSKAADCWRLWKKTRGRSINGESSERKKQWLAVELADNGADHLHDVASSSAINSPQGHHSNLARPQLLSSQSDGLTVAWSPSQNFGTNVQQECLIPIRFNFLSTDFMPSKGVKGAPMRLCVKTKVSQSGAPTRALSAHKTAQHLSPILPTNPFDAEHQASSGNLVHSLDETTNETWYCKLQAFRDHGAERKFQNHRQQIENAIANNTAKLANLLNGLKNGGNALRTTSGSSPSSDPGSARVNAGVSKVIKRRKCAGSADVISRVQSKIDALRFALDSAEDCIMLTMTSWHSDDDPDAVRPDILNENQPEISSASGIIGHDIDAPITTTGLGPVLARSLPSVHGASGMGPTHARPHSAGDSGYPMFLSSPIFPGATEAAASPYTDLQDAALGYNTVTAQTSLLYPLEDFMPPASEAWANHEESAREPWQSFTPECHYGDMQYRLKPYFNDFTVPGGMKQEWVDLNDPMPMTSTGQVC